MTRVTRHEGPDPNRPGRSRTRSRGTPCGGSSAAIGAFWLAEVFGQLSGRRPRGSARSAPDLTIVALDPDPQPGHRADPADVQPIPERGRPAGEPDRDSALDPPGHPRRGPRVPHPARPRPASCSRSSSGCSAAATRRPGHGDARAAGHRRHRAPPAASAAPRSPSTWRPPWPSQRRTRPSSLDFDLLFGSVDACLDIIPDHTLHGVVQNIDRLDLTLLKRSMTRHSLGAVRPAPPGRAWRTPPRSIPRRCAGCSACSRRPSPRSSSTPARASSRPTSSPSRWPT